jgi:hypothetical protein
MKSRSIRAAVLSALFLTSPALTLAAGQPKLHMLNKSQMQDLSGATPAVKQGKGAGLSRNFEVSSANDFHLAAANQLQAPGDESVDARLSRTDSAFRK